MNTHTEKKDKGFTLVELLIVIVILGILSTVTVFAVRGITNRGEVSACQADKKTIEVAIEAWYAMPSTGTGARTDGGTAGEPSEADLVASGLLRDVSAKHDVGAAGAITAIAPCT